VVKQKKQVQEKRKAPRAQIRARVDFEVRSKDTFLFEYTTDMSRDGIFLSTRNPLPVGARIQMKFQAPQGGRVIEVEGKVVWINPYRPGGENINPGMGIQFLNLSEEDKEAITKLVRKKAVLAD